MKTNKMKKNNKQEYEETKEKQNNIRITRRRK